MSNSGFNTTFNVGRGNSYELTIVEEDIQTYIFLGEDVKALFGKSVSQINVKVDGGSCI